MAQGFRQALYAILLALTWLATTSMSVRASEPSGIIAVVSDIHFNPFTTRDFAVRLASSDGSPEIVQLASERMNTHPETICRQAAGAAA